MLGNFSFGDYFKKEAIGWAWEFLTEKLEIPKEKLWASIYFEDDEAFDIWNKIIGVPEERIVRLGKEDNFWELEVGPSGPCSEIYVDRGEEYGCGSATCQPGCDCDRYIEVWNLVFTQFDKDEQGNYAPLPNPNIDTGMGLERITAVMEEAKTIFDTLEIQKILNKVEKISSTKYGTDSKTDTSIRVITDHSRAMTFLVSDGVLPGNEGRGYILRRLIRRAARHGKLLGLDNAFLGDIVDVVIESWQIQYPELKEREDQIKRVIKAEEDKFQETIHQGMNILESYINEIIKSEEKTLSGENAFKLYDTYGFPLDLTKEILEERSLFVDENGFNENMEKQRQRARKAREDGDNSGWNSVGDQNLFNGIETIFRGYETTKLESAVIALFKDNEKVTLMSSGEEGILILKETPFYGESGGQVGDKGIIEGNNFKIEVIDTKRTKEDLIIHIVKILDGSIKIDDLVTATVNDDRRDSLRRNHSATHLLDRALKDVLGDHVNQAGSIVLPNRLRFDFTHFESITKESLSKIEKIVNDKIFAGLNVETIETTLSDAKDIGVVGLFEDKYKDEVRVIKMGEYSKELCGGTHVSNTNNIGIFKIVSESSISSGVRRIEALTGYGVYEYMNHMEKEIEDMTNILKTNRNDIVEKVKTICEDIKGKDKLIESLKSKMASSIAEDILDTKVDVEGIQLILYKVENMDMNGLRNLGDEIRNRLGSGVIVLASVFEEKLSFVAMATKDIVKKGVHVGNIIKEVAKATDGNGGGRPDMAQAGGKDISKVDEALKIVPEIIKQQIK